MNIVCFDTIRGPDPIGRASSDNILLVRVEEADTSNIIDAKK